MALVAPSPSGDRDDRLEYFVGAWDVHVTFKLPDGSEGQGSARCEARTILDGAFLEQEYESVLGGQRLMIRQFLGYDDRRQAYVQFHLHEGGGAPTQTRHLEGSFSAEGSLLELEGKAFDPFTGEPVGMRTVTLIVDDNRFVVEEWFGPPGEPEERRVVLHHTRRLGNEVLNDPE